MAKGAGNGAPLDPTGHRPALLPARRRTCLRDRQPVGPSPCRPAANAPQSLTVLACALATRSILAKDASAAESDISSARRAWKQAQQMKPGIGLDMTWVSPRIRAALQSKGG